VRAKLLSINDRHLGPWPDLTSPPDLLDRRHEVARKLATDVDAERLTRLDRMLIAEEQDQGIVDLRPDAAESYTVRGITCAPLAQRVEVADNEVRIVRSKNDLLTTLVAAQRARLAAIGVPRFVPGGRRERDSNPRWF
jgi:hypothetical protein